MSNLRNPLAFILLFFLWQSAPSQSLSKAQMYEDYDFLLGKIRELNPSLEIKRTLFHYSILDTLQQMRAEVEECETFDDFHFLAVRAMNTCIDGHSAVRTPLLPMGIKLYIPLIYREGFYLVRDDFSYGDTFFPAGAVLVAINGNGHIHEEVRRQIPGRYLMRWDNQKKQFYSEQFYLSLNYVRAGGLKLDFSYDKQIISADFRIDEEVRIRQPRQWKDNVTRIHYFEPEEILYIRLPEMNYAARNRFRKEIPRLLRGRKPRKIVIDLRGNMGGSSLVGRNLMRSILPEPVHLQTRVYGNEPVGLSRSYRRMHGFMKSPRQDTLAELGGIPMIAYIDREEEVRPYPGSIRHTGPIYLIGDEHVYSAGGAIFDFARASDTDSIFSIGTPTGWFLGEFPDPVPFTLPHSKLECWIAPAVSLTGVTGWEDLMHDHYDYTVYPDLNDYLNLARIPAEATYRTLHLEKDVYMRPVLTPR